MTTRYVDLRDVTFVCTIDELRSFADFVAKAYEDVLARAESHAELDEVHHIHFQDYAAEWIPTESDVIIMTIADEESISHD